jgi:hypothetical protein
MRQEKYSIKTALFFSKIKHFKISETFFLSKFSTLFGEK